MTDQSFLAAVTEVAAVTPSRTALWDGDRRLSYRELVERGNVLSGRLRGLGIQPGDRVMLVAENSADYLLTAFAVWQAGGVLATVYPSSAASELGYAVTNAAPRLIITQPHLADAITAATADRQIPLRLLGGDDLLADSSGGGDLLAGGDLVAGLPAAAAEPALIAVDPDGPALICYTSGTTSHPKPVTHSHRGLAAAAAAYASVWRLGPQDRTAVCLPMAWAFGLVTTSMAALTAGGTVVSLPRFRADQLLDAIETHRVTFFAGVTTMYVKLVSRLREAGAARDLSSLRLCISGGEPRNEAVFAEWRRLTGRPVHDVYASSECFPVVTYDPELDPQPRPGSAGRAAPGVQIRVVDADGNDVARGVPGEALCRGPALMLGYWEEPELTAAAITEDGWHRSRDLVRVDHEGYVHVLGRLSDMIIRGGSNIAPAEVESVLGQHPDLLESVVVGLPDPRYGQLVAAAVVLAPAAPWQPASLAAWCERRLAGYKVPSVFQRFDEFPRNATGKVQRDQVAQALREGPHPQPASGEPHHEPAGGDPQVTEAGGR